jgi:D-alanyl-D-alanine carboxypeptidase (penicillin-binding protein 5/6)
MKKPIAPLFLLLFLAALLPARAAAVELPLTSRAALLMEKTTGTILFAQNEHEQLEPASVTKIMTLLLTMDAIDSGALSYDDVVTVSANAAGMGGSQVFLSEGERITVEELLKCVCVSSGNDAAVALAEKVSGVTELFVEQMNNRARGLGMDDTHFVNPTGLTASGHVTSAHDVAVMSRELLTRHPDIRRFTTIWTDSIRNGTFDLANTNKLIRWYDGATGLKTGYTVSAGYCISATAERDGMELIAVVMKGESSDKRNTDAKALLNYGFSAYTLVSAAPEEPLPVLPVTMGERETVSLTLPAEGTTAVVEKTKASSLERHLTLPDTLTSPVAAGQPVGTLTLCSGGEELLTVPVLSAEDVPSRTWSRMFTDLLRMAVFAS